MTAISQQVAGQLPQFTSQNLSNTAWAFAALGLRDEPLFAAMSQQALATVSLLSERDLSAMVWSFANLALRDDPFVAAIRNLLREGASHFQPRSLSNISWAFATLKVHDSPLFVAMAKALLNKIKGSPDGKLEDMLTNLKAMAWSLNFCGAASEDLDKALLSSILHLAERQDLELQEKVRKLVPAAASSISREEYLERGADPDVPPFVVIDLPEVCVVHKPPGWEVDSADVGSGLLLSEYLQRQFSVSEAPLVYFSEYQFGMVHRLDRVSSGLLLIGKTLKGFHFLGWQLNTGRLEREYVVLAHGWVDPSLQIIDAPVLHIHAEGARESRVSEQGKPSLTQLKTLGHYTLKSEDDDRFSLVAIAIRTGRRHQIRAHMAHVGHPTVADGKYSSREAFVRDKQWCPRNFLHRYRLSFKDSAMQAHEALAALPEDLKEASAHLVAVGPKSDQALTEWLRPDSQRKAWRDLDCLAGFMT